MKTSNSGSHPVLSQTEKNTTLWLGALNNAGDHEVGQIFRSPAEARVDTIQVYSSAVTMPGEIAMTLHEFDVETKTWGPSFATANCILERGDDGQWISFHFPAVTLYRDRTYGFRLQANDALIGIGEAATATTQPFSFGYEWNSAGPGNGRFFTYFSLAYKIGLRA